MSETKRIFGLTFVLFFAVFPKTRSNQLEEIPLDSWVYPVIDELHFQGFFPKLFIADKPYARGEISAYLFRVKQEMEAGTLTLKPHQRWLFERLFDEFHLELAPPGAIEEKVEELPLTFRWGAAFNLRSDFHKEDEPFHKPVFNAFVGAELGDRFYFRSRARVENHLSGNPSVWARPWTRNDLGGTLDDTYLKYHWKYFDLIWGRQRLQWGPGFAEVDLISPNPPPFDMLRLKAAYKALRFQFFFTRLDDAVNPAPPNDTVPRYFSAHRLEVKPATWLEFSLSEVVVYGGPKRQMEWYYLLPFVPYYGEQYNNRKNDNPVWSIDWSITPHKNFGHYGEFLIDDFQIDCLTGDCSEPQEIGIRAGLVYHSFGPWPRNFLNVEYSLIKKYVYGQDQYYNLYLFHGLPIGAPQGPDADYLLVRYKQYLNANLDAGFQAEYRRHGEGQIGVQPVKVPFTNFPSGVVDRTLTFQFSTAYQYKAHFFARLDLGTKNRDNVGNQAGAAGRDRFINLQLGYNFWRENRY